VAQRQITKPIEAKELPDLTEQQQEFVRQRLAGKNATDAYRAAYDTADMLQRTVWAEASRTNSNPNVAAWLAASREAHLGTAVLTLNGHMAELERLREIALKTGNIGAAVQAEQLRGKVAGHQIERTQEVPIDPVQTLKDIARDQPDIAASLAAQAGIPWADIDDSKRTLN